ncbi:MAG: glutaredoxin [archaeon]
MGITKIPVLHGRIDDSIIRVYVKTYCPFCIKLLKLLDAKGIRYETVDVIKDKAMYKEMQKKSGKGDVPQVEMKGSIIPDYGSEEELVLEIEKLMRR